MNPTLYDLLIAYYFLTEDYDLSIGGILNLENGEVFLTTGAQMYEGGMYAYKARKRLGLEQYHFQSSEAWLICRKGYQELALEYERI